MEPNQANVRYDSDADVLSIEGIPHAPITHAQEMGNFVVHFGPQGEPVLIEVLEASRTLKGQSEPLAQVAALAAAA